MAWTDEDSRVEKNVPHRISVRVGESVLVRVRHGKLISLSSSSVVAGGFTVGINGFFSQDVKAHPRYRRKSGSTADQKRKPGAGREDKTQAPLQDRTALGRYSTVDTRVHAGGVAFQPARPFTRCDMQGTTPRSHF